MKDKFLITDTFIESISSFDKNMKASLWKCLGLLSANRLHPSLNTEKLNGLYSSRINIDYRLIHEPSVRVYRLLYAGKHDEAYQFADNYAKQIKDFKREPKFMIGRGRPEYNVLLKRKEKRIAPRRTLSLFIIETVNRFRKRDTQDQLAGHKIYTLRKLKKVLS